MHGDGDGSWRSVWWFDGKGGGAYIYSNLFAVGDRFYGQDGREIAALDCICQRYIYIYRISIPVVKSVAPVSHQLSAPPLPVIPGLLIHDASNNV